MEHFGTDNMENATGAFNKDQKTYENANAKHESAIPVWKSAQESWSSAQSAWTRIQKEYGYGEREYTKGRSDFEAAAEAYKQAEATYTAIKAELEAASGKITNNITSIGGHTSDYSYTTRWSNSLHGNNGYGGMFYASGTTQTFNSKVRVDVGFGTANVGDKKVDFKSTNLTAFSGKNYTNVQGFPINNSKPIGFVGEQDLHYINKKVGIAPKGINTSL